MHPPPAARAEPSAPGRTRDMSRTGYDLRVGEVGLSVRVDVGPPLRCSHPAFEAAVEAPDISVNVELGRPRVGHPEQLVFDAGSPWCLYRGDPELRFVFHSGSTHEAPYKTAEVDDEFSTCRVVMDERIFPGDGPVDPLEYPLDELLVLHRLGLDGGCELHSCSVVIESGAGLVFAGQSGDGKTTLARLWAEHSEADVLSDDRTIVRSDERGARMYGTPWHGEGRFAAARSAPLWAVFVLEHGSETEISGLRRAEALSLLMARTFTTFFDPRMTTRTLEVLDRLTERVPCYRLRFRPEPEALDAVRAVVGAS